MRLEARVESFDHAGAWLILQIWFGMLMIIKLSLSQVGTGELRP